MSALAIAQAPPLSMPLRFLLSAPPWGVAAGVWIVWHGDGVMTSRWAMSTVVWVHLITLGVLGNATLGSLVQFLPVAAGSTFVSMRGIPLLHATFNAGLALLVTGMTLEVPAAVLSVAAVLLVCSVLTFAVLALRALYRGHGAQWLRGAIALALSWLLATAMLGGFLAAALAGSMTLPLDRFTDVHAAAGLLGWTLLLMAVVGCVTMPMFQGTHPVPTAALSAWLALTTIGLIAGDVLRVAGIPSALAWAIATPTLLLTATWLGLQWRARHRRNPALTASWACGALAIAAASALLLSAPLPGIGNRDVLVGALAIGVGLPLILLGMQMEIVAFLAWIQLRQSCPRGRKIPGVGQLLPEAARQRALRVHLVAAVMLIVATQYPSWSRAAGVALTIAYTVTVQVLFRCLLDTRRFLHLTAEPST